MQLTKKDCARRLVLLKLTTDKALRDLFATAELLVYDAERVLFAIAKFLLMPAAATRSVARDTCINLFNYSSSNTN